MRKYLLPLALVLMLAPSAQATTITYTAVLDGPSEFPPNASPATGFTTVITDDVAHTLSIDVLFADLLGPNIAAHIHCCTTIPGVGAAPVATVTPTFTGFPSGTTSGTYSHVFDTTLASTYRAGFLAGYGGSTAAAEADLFANMLAGATYLNIHSTIFTGGEIRGFLTVAPPAADAVPEPASLLLLGTGISALAVRRRQSRRK